MFPPTFQNHLAQLATLGVRMNQLARGQNLEGAVSTAHQVLSLLKEDPLSQAVPQDIQAIEARLSEKNTDDLHGAITELSRLIQSLGASPRSLLSIVQSAPDQGGPKVDRLRTGMIDTLAHFWERGEHEEAREFLEVMARTARDGDAGCMRQLGEVVCSDQKTIAVNMTAVAEVLEAIGWSEFALKIIDPSYPLLIPGFVPHRRNPNLLMPLLKRPPGDAKSIGALTSVLRERSVKDPWDLRGYAAQGLLTLTAPERESVLSVTKYWKMMIEFWPIRLPVLYPFLFGPPASGPQGIWREGESRWDLYEEHLRTAFSIAENPKQPISLRREALASVWNGYSGPDCAPSPLWMVSTFRTRDLAKQEPQLNAAMHLQRHDVRHENMPETSPAEEPRQWMEQLAIFARKKPRHLRLISGAEDAFAGPVEENLKKLAALSDGLNSYGLILEPSLVSGVMQNALGDVIASSGTSDGSGVPASSDSVTAFRRSLYALHPAAAVTAWLDATGSPWPSHDLARGHRLEGALALLQWIRDREREPDELKNETAKRYWEIDERLSPRKWRAVEARPLEWWKHRLAQDLPAALAGQMRDTRQTGTPHDWKIFAQNHPEALSDLRALSQSPLPGTRALAQNILQILSFKAG